VFGEKGILVKGATSTRLGLVMILQQIYSVAIRAEFYPDQMGSSDHIIHEI
jgi:hypothetical protein